MLTNCYAHTCTIYPQVLGQVEKRVLIYLGSELISRDGNCVMKDIFLGGLLHVRG